MQIKIHKSFDEFIKNSKHFEKMLIFIENEKNIAPLKENVFRFMEVNLDKLKCIILGMDPYPSTYVKDNIKIPVATGRSFEVANVVKWTDRYRQSSLAVIFKTLMYYKTKKVYSMEELRNVDEKTIKFIKMKDWFDAMEQSGVMFLNASLTTRIGESNVHMPLWKDFMDELIKFITSKNEYIKWLIWGQNALDRVTGLVDKKNIVYTCHPASRVNNNFVTDCCFNKVKDIEWF